MRCLDGYRLRLAVAGCVGAMVFAQAGSARADFTFGTPTRLGPMVNSWSDDYSPCLSADGLSLFFASTRFGGYGSYDIWVSTRQTTTDDWGAAENLGPPVNSAHEDVSPTISPDGLELYFSSFRPGGAGGVDIWVVTRQSPTDPWDQPENLGPVVNSAADEVTPSLSPDGLKLYFAYGRQNGTPQSSIYVTSRDVIGAAWSAPVSLGSVVNSRSCQWNPTISGDGRLFFFSDYWDCSPGAVDPGTTDIRLTMRATGDSDWVAPVCLELPDNSVFAEDSPMISADGSTLYFSSDAYDEPEGWNNLDIWQASVLPVVDFDGDGDVGLNDLDILTESWGQSDPLCDVGPMPWGDGIVDIADLEVLVNNWGKVDPGLIAHWKLDEWEGTTAHDSAGIYGANLIGGPIWQPDGGMISGALLFDGIDDYVETPPIEIFSEDSSFSLFAWVKGGGLNQVIIAPNMWPILLQADHLEGNLMTAFLFYDNDFLISEAPIIDGQWHEVGLVWDADSLTRTLFVDGTEVAGDTVSKAPNSGSGLQKIRFGMWDYGSTGAWSGLIDDVRIYNRAVGSLQQQTFSIPEL